MKTKGVAHAAAPFMVDWTRKETWQTFELSLAKDD